MVIVALGIVWAGFLLASFGARLYMGGGVGLLDLAIPGYYAQHHKAP